MSDQTIEEITAAAYDEAIAPAYGLKWDQLEESIRKNYVDLVRAVLNGER
jgi:hypothetical protein